MAMKPNSQSFSADRNSGPSLIPSYSLQLGSSDDTSWWSLPQLLLVVRRRAALIAVMAIAVTSVSWYRALNQKPTYVGEFQLLVEPITDDSQGKLRELTGQENTSPRDSNLDYRTQTEILRSPKLLLPVIKQIRPRYPDVSYSSLTQKLAVIQPEGTRILKVSYQDADPQKIKFVLDQVVQGYLTYSQQERQANLRKGIEFVDNQIPKTQKRVDSLQYQLQSFRQKNEFVDPQSKSEQIANQLNLLEQQRLEVEKQLAETKKSDANLANRSGRTATLAESETYQRTLENLQEVDRKIANSAARFKANSPVMQGLQEKRQGLVPLVNAEAQKTLANRLAILNNQLSILNVRQKEIADAELQWKQKANELPVTARQYTDLQRELIVATESLNRFLQTRETLQVEAAQKENPWQVLAPPQKPQFPIDSITRNLVLGAITGVLLGLVAALLTERLDSSFRSIEELKKQIKLPLLGVIPFHAVLTGRGGATVKREQASPPQGLRNMFGRRAESHDFTQFVFSEAFRSLYTNIGMMSPDRPIRSLVVSSALAGEGKSTVAINLAQAAAAMGQRVLLVDADLRRPQIGKRLNLPDEPGLSNLIGTNLQSSQIIRQVSLIDPELASISNKLELLISDQLSVLTSGQIPPDPTKLLSSRKMQDLMEHFQTLFDLVIYDAPPLLNLADSNLLAAKTDGTILIIRLDKTDRFTIAEALDNLKTTHLSVLGIVANGSRNQAFVSPKYSYKYWEQ
jgi:capsular exopolysaccharide synthesis family protein